jgi:hypothetical protein
MNYLKEYNILKLQNGGNIGEEIRTFLQRRKTHNKVMSFIN